MMKRAALSLAIACAALAGCAGPQTRQDYINEVSTRDSMFLMKDTYVAKRNFDQVVAALKANAEDCFSYSRSQTFVSGGMVTGGTRTDGHASVNVVAPGKAQLTSQYQTFGIQVVKVPEGGFYYMAVDIDRLTPTTTRLSYYGAKDKDAWNLIRNWSDGGKAACARG